MQESCPLRTPPSRDSLDRSKIMGCENEESPPQGGYINDLNSATTSQIIDSVRRILELTIVMRAFVLSATLVVLVAVAVQADEKKANEKITEVFNKCKEKWPVTDEEVQQVKEKQSIPDSKNVKCILACMLTEAKVLKDGEYNKENALLMADVLHKDEPEQAEKSKEIVELCTKEIGTDTKGDDCEYAYKMAVCSSKHAKELGVKTPEF